MSQNTYKESVIKLAKQIKKEHFLKTALWSVGIILTLVWFSMLIATSVSSGERLVLGEEITSLTNLDPTRKIAPSIVEKEDGTFRIGIFYVLERYDWNPLCLTYDPDLVGWFVCVILAPVGYMGIIFIIAYMKNMITPQQVKKTVRKALQFGYLKQKDVDYVIDEIDYNIGIKERRNETTNTEEQKQT